MRVRHKAGGYYGSSSKFNVHSMNEIIVHFEGSGGASSEYPSDYLFQLRSGKWVPFSDPRIQPDDANREFGEIPDGSDPYDGGLDWIDLAAEVRPSAIAGLRLRLPDVLDEDTDADLAIDDERYCCAAEEEREADLRLNGWRARSHG